MMDQSAGALVSAPNSSHFQPTARFRSQGTRASGQGDGTRPLCHLLRLLPARRPISHACAGPNFAWSPASDLFTLRVCRVVKGSMQLAEMEWTTWHAIQAPQPRCRTESHGQSCSQRTRGPPCSRLNTSNPNGILKRRWPPMNKDASRQ